MNTRNIAIDGLNVLADDIAGRAVHRKRSLNGRNRRKAMQDILTTLWFRSSLTSCDTRSNMSVIIALTSVIPLLCVAYLFIIQPAFAVTMAVTLSALASAISGFIISTRYPKAFAQLRDYLKEIAEGNVPDVVGLIGEDTDLRAIQRYIILMLDDLKRKIRLIEEQKSQLVELERRKAILNTIATACHYLGQPATIAILNLELLTRWPHGPEQARIICECKEALLEIRRLLLRLNELDDFKMEAYLPNEQQGHADKGGDSILILDRVA